MNFDFSPYNYKIKQNVFVFPKFPDSFLVLNEHNFNIFLTFLEHNMDIRELDIID